MAGYVKEYRESLTYVMSADPHTVGALDFIHLGISQARRG